MDFFAEQDQARKRSKWLVVAFFGTILAISLIFFAIMASVTDQWSLYGSDFAFIARDFGGVFLAVGGVISLGSLFKLFQLRAGGSVVARDMGAREVDPSTVNADERRLLNIVEEMSIASGIPAPGVWVMDEEHGINAFAAGTTPSNAVVAVTRGCLINLSRDELQGVVAHEFSHILNGDMRLNMRLIGVIFGIIMIALIGRTLLHAIRFSGSSRNRDGQQIMLALFAAGIAIFIIGSIGEFFARLIQAAISRQREFLADASAVQFTRNPDGLKNALMKIGSVSTRGALQASQGSEASHMMFAASGFFSWGLATHPPLEKRILALDPSWDGKMEAPRRRTPKSKPSRTQKVREGFDHEGILGAAVALEAMRGLGQTEAQDVGKGQQIHEALDPLWIEAVHDRSGAQLLIYGLLLGTDGVIAEGETSYLAKQLGDEGRDICLRWHEALDGEHSAVKIALVDLAIPTLRKLSRPEYLAFREMTQWLIASDSQIDLFEFMLQRMIRRHLDFAMGLDSPPGARWRTLDQLDREVGLIVSAVANLSDDAGEAFARGATAFREKVPAADALQLAKSLDLSGVEQALRTCEIAPATVRRDVVQVCAAAVMADGEVNNREIELLRAVADAIGVAVPPIVMNTAA